MARFLAESQNILTENKIQLLMGGIAVKSLLWFGFSKEELYIFKLAFLQAVERQLRESSAEISQNANKSSSSPRQYKVNNFVNNIQQLLNEYDFLSNQITLYVGA